MRDIVIKLEYVANISLGIQSPDGLESCTLVAYERERLVWQCGLSVKAEISRLVVIIFVFTFSFLLTFQ